MKKNLRKTTRQFMNVRRYVAPPKKSYKGLWLVGTAVGAVALTVLKMKQDKQCYKEKEVNTVPFRLSNNKHDDRQVYFVGGGLGSLAGAAYLIRLWL